MKKRLISLLLLVCMLVSLVPTIAVPAIAATEVQAALADVDEKIRIQFRLADTNGWGRLGTLIAERTMEKGLCYFDLPTETECYAKGLNPKDILGWYTMLPDGTVIDAAAYSGTRLQTDLTFYPVMISSTFSPLKDQNMPLVYKAPEKNVYVAFDEYRGGWTGGIYADGSFSALNMITDSGLAISNNLSAWSNGGIYYVATSANFSWVLSENTSRVLAAQYTALATGTVDLDFSQIKLFNGAANTTVSTTPAVYLAVAVNDQIVWPDAAVEKGTAVVSTGFAEKGWQEVAYAGTDAVSGTTYTVAVDGGKITGLSVNAGDTISFVLGRKDANIKMADLSPTVTYTSVGAVWDAIIRDGADVPTTYVHTSNLFETKTTRSCRSNRWKEPRQRTWWGRSPTPARGHWLAIRVKVRSPHVAVR